jgi:TonB-linked SusC/RagA family outer membrane protein
MHHCSFALRSLLYLSAVFFFSTLLTFQSYAQDMISARGKVMDGDKKLPVSGASVTVKGNTMGTVTDVNGEFSLQVPKGSILLISFAGFQPVEIAAAESMPVINILPQTGSLSEVVVIGYGERRKKDLTGAVSSMSAKDIQKSTALSPEMAMQGRMPGVFVSTPGGAPNARPTVRIRGVNTFGYAEPLYVIDGVPITEGGQGSSGGAIADLRSPINIFATINPSDIESISVLKDASAAAIYGVRASNGVILITTKRGRTGKPRVSFNASYGSQNIPKTISTLSTQQYVSLYEEAYNNNPNINAGSPVPFPGPFGPTFDKNSPSYLGNSSTYNWQDALINENANIQDYSVSMNGGSEATTYYLSLGYSSTESPLKGNEMNRYTIASNVESRISKWLKAGLMMRLAQSGSLENTNGTLGDMMIAPPWQKVYDPNGPSGFAPVSKLTFTPNPDFDPSKRDPGPQYNVSSTELLWGPQTRSNPLGLQTTRSLNYDVMRALGNAFLEVEPIKGLKVRGSMGGDIFFNKGRNWRAFEDYLFLQTPGNPYANQDGNAKGFYEERHTRNYNLVKELTASYNLKFGGAHNLDLIAGALDQHWRWEVAATSSPVNFSDPSLRRVTQIPPYVSGYTAVLSDYALQGYFGRASYNYNGKYYLDVTVRRDGSSRFAPDYRWGTFPSFAAAWRLTDEKFMRNNKWLTDLKLRAGWGELGNEQTTSGFAYLSGVSLSPDYALGSGNGNATGTMVNGARLPNFPNNDLTWERVRTTNIGFDAVIKGKFNLTVEYYDKLTKGIIQSVVLPPNGGIESTADLNIASVKNTGFEFDLGYRDQFGNLGFTFNANLTTVKNRVEELFQNNPLGGSLGRIEVGKPMYYLWGYQVGGIFQNQAEIDAWRAKNADLNLGQSKSDPTAGYVYKPGDMYFRDIYGNPREPKQQYSPNPDSLVNASDRTYLGKTIPGYFYGFNFGFNWKGFDLSLFFQGVGNVQRYNDVRASGESMGSNGANQWASTLDRWTPSNPSNSMPRAVFQDPAQATRFSDRFIENAGFLRLRNLQIGYSLPKDLLRKAGFIENLRFYFSGVNLLTMTSWSGIDPENDFIPPTRQLLFGINANF